MRLWCPIWQIANCEGSLKVNVNILVFTFFVHPLLHLIAVVPLHLFYSHFCLHACTIVTTACDLLSWVPWWWQQWIILNNVLKWALAVSNKKKAYMIGWQHKWESGTKHCQPVKGTAWTRTFIAGTPSIMLLKTAHLKVLQIYSYCKRRIQE